MLPPLFTHHTHFMMRLMPSSGLEQRLLQLLLDSSKGTDVVEHSEEDMVQDSPETSLLEANPAKLETNSTATTTITTATTTTSQTHASHLNHAGIYEFER